MKFCRNAFSSNPLLITAKAQQIVDGNSVELLLAWFSQYNTTTQEQFEVFQLIQFFKFFILQFEQNINFHNLKKSFPNKTLNS
jgi:hypothetical protein